MSSFSEASCFSRGLKEIPLYQLSCMQIRFKKRKTWMGIESNETLQSITWMKCKGKHTFVCVKVTASRLTLKRLTRKHLLLQKLKSTWQKKVINGQFPFKMPKLRNKIKRMLRLWKCPLL